MSRNITFSARDDDPLMRRLLRALLDESAGRAAEPAAAKPEPPMQPTADRKITGILDSAPDSLAQLPKFFEGLNDEQLDHAWVACVIDCIAGPGRAVDVCALSAVLNAVRNRYRVSAITDCTPADAAGTPADADSAGETLVDLLRRARLLAPKPGDEVEAARITGDDAAVRALRKALDAGAEPRLRFVRGNRWGPHRIRRVRP
jgi:hypothetical protein